MSAQDPYCYPKPHKYCGLCITPSSPVPNAYVSHVLFRVFPPRGGYPITHDRLDHESAIIDLLAYVTSAKHQDHTAVSSTAS